MEPVELPPPQLEIAIVADRARQSIALVKNARPFRGRTSSMQKASVPAASGQRECGCRNGVASAVVGRVASIVTVAVAAPLTVTEPGAMLQLNCAEDGVHARLTEPLNPLSEARFKPIVAEAPEATESCGDCAASVKSPIAVCVAVTFSTLLVEGA